MIFSLKDEISVYISLHSYGQLWLIPYAYKEKIYSTDFNDLLAVARKGEKALEEVHKSHYKVENAADLYPAAGISEDWVKAIAGIKYSFTIELRPSKKENQESDSNEDGHQFILPADQIIPTGEELLAGLISVADLFKTINETRVNRSIIVLPPYLHIILTVIFLSLQL